jgi:hypothetical protein
VLVKQDEARVELHLRESNGRWLIVDVDGMTATLPLPQIGIELPLAEIYDGVDFTTER